MDAHAVSMAYVHTLLMADKRCFWAVCLLQENKPVVLTKQSVDGIQLQGGTILGTSRGGANMK